MKVLMLMNSTNVRLGGGIIQIILNLKEILDKKNINVTYAINCCSESGIPELLNDKKSTFIQLPNKKENLLNYCKKLNEIMKQEKYDVVHVHGNSANMIIELFIAKINDIKIRIAHSHNSKCSHPFLNKLLIPFFRKTYTKAIACSKIAGEWLFKSNFKVFNNSIEIDKFIFNKQMRKKYREKLTIKDDTIVFGHVGNLCEQKNQEFLIDVFSEYCNRNPNSLLISIGEGKDKDILIKKVHNLKLENKVIFLGLQKDVSNWLNAFDVFVFPSKWEGFGIALLEAQASGLPVVSSTAAPKIVKINNNFIFADLNESIDVWVKKIIKVINFNFERTVDKNRFNQYNIDSQVKKLLDLYEYKESDIL